MRARPNPGDDRGVVIPIMAFSLVTLLVMVSFAVDLGNARQFRRQAQATADTAALAGAAELNGQDDASRRSLAVTQVKLYALRNFNVATSAWQGCDQSVAVPAGWTAPDSAASNRCILVNSANDRVRITHLPAKPVLTFFGRAAGVDDIDVTAAATAIVRPGGVSPCGFCVLGDFDAQNGDITVTGNAGASIGGTAAAGPNGGLVVSGPGNEIRIHNNGVANRPANFSPTPTSVPGPLPDPLAGLSAPATNGTFRSPCVGPGVYSSIPTGCAIPPGLYVITGGTHISGSSAIDATSGVTFYFTCAGPPGTARPCGSGGEAGAELVCTGNATFNANAQPAAGTPVGGAIPGVAVFFDRNNTGAFDCRGNGASPVIGTIYGARAELRMRGNGACTFTDSLVVVGEVTFSGNPSACSITYNAANNAQPTGSVALIE